MSNMSNMSTNRIWKCTWWNEDDYGTTREVSVVIQGDAMTSADATEKARKYLKDQSIETDFSKYDNYKTHEVTDETILALNHLHIV